MTLTVEKRMAMERRIVRKLLVVARDHGYKPVRVDDGCEDLCKAPKTDADVVSAVFSVDESIIRFRRDGEKRVHCAVIILGNDGWDCIADNSTGGDWDDVMAIMDQYVDSLCA